MVDADDPVPIVGVSCVAERRRNLVPEFDHINWTNNVLPKLGLLGPFGFYPDVVDTESCGAHSPLTATFPAAMERK